MSIFSKARAALGRAHRMFDEGARFGSLLYPEGKSRWRSTTTWPIVGEAETASRGKIVVVSMHGRIWYDFAHRTVMGPASTAVLRDKYAARPAPRPVRFAVGQEVFWLSPRANEISPVVIMPFEDLTPQDAEIVHLHGLGDVPVPREDLHATIGEARVKLVSRNLRHDPSSGAGFCRECLAYFPVMTPGMSCWGCDPEAYGG